MADIVDIAKIDVEIQTIHGILRDSIDEHYGLKNNGKRLSTEEHFVFWDRMWALTQLKRKTMAESNNINR